MLPESEMGPAYEVDQKQFVHAKDSGKAFSSDPGSVFHSGWSSFAICLHSREWAFSDWAFT